MRQLCHNIINATPSPPSSRFSADLRDLVSKILTKDPKLRPGINNILSRPIMKNRIRDFLNDTKFQNEFNHTVLHGMNVLNGPPPVPAAVQPKPVVNNFVPPPSSAILRSNNGQQLNPLLAPPRQQQPLVPAPQPVVIRQSPSPTPANFLVNPPIAASPPLPRGFSPVGMMVPAKKPEVAVNVPMRKPGEVINIPAAGAFSKGTPVARVPPPPSVAVNNSNNNYNHNAARLRVQMKPPIPNQQPPQPRNDAQRPQSNNQAVRPPVSYNNVVQKVKPAPSVQVQQQRQPAVPIRAVSADSNNNRQNSFPDQDAQLVGSEKNNNVKLDNNKNPFGMIVGARNVHVSVVSGVAKAPAAATENEKRSSPLTVVEARNDKVAMPSHQVPKMSAAEKIAAARAMKQNIPAIAEYSPPLVSNKNAIPSLSPNASNVPSQVQNRPMSSEDRMKEVDVAVNKVAQMMQNLKSPAVRSPVPVMSPSIVVSPDFVAPVSRPGIREPSSADVGAAVLSKPDTRSPVVPSAGAPPAWKVPLAENKKEDNVSWLSDLQCQMGALKQQVHVLQQNNQRSPMAPSPIPTPTPTPAPAPAKKDQAKPSPLPGGGDSGKNYAVKRQSFPVDDRRMRAERASNQVQVASELDAPQSVGSVPSSVASSNSNNANNKKKGGRVSDAKPETAKGRKPQAQPPSVSPVPAVDLDQRRELREKHKMGFREFLKQQRGQEGAQTPLTDAGSIEDNEDTVSHVSIASSERSTPVLFEPTPLAVVEAGSWDMGTMLSPPPSSVVSSMQQSQRSISSLSTSASTKTSKPASSNKESSISLRKFIENQRRAAHKPSKLNEDRNHGNRSSTAADVQIFESTHRFTPPPPSTSSSSVKSAALVGTDTQADKNEWIQEEMFKYVKSTRSEEGEQPTTPRSSCWNNRDDDDDLNADERPTDPQVRLAGGFHAIVDENDEAPMRGCNLAEAFVDDDEVELISVPASQSVEDVDSEKHSPSEEDFLGKSFVLQMRDEEQQAYRMVLDAKAAMEYSIMIQQMQEILQLGAMQAKELDAVNYESSHRSNTNGNSTSGDKSGKGDEKLLVITEGIEGEEEEIEEGFEEAAFTFYLSDSDDEKNLNRGGNEEDEEDLNEFGEEYLKEIADPVEEVAEEALDHEYIAGEIPTAGHEQPLFKRTDPGVFAQLGRPPRPSGGVDVEGAADDVEEESVDIDIIDSDTARSRLLLDPFNDTTRNFVSTKPDRVGNSRLQSTSAISAASESQLQASLSKTQKQQIYRKLEMLLGADRLEKGLQFLSSTHLEDESADEEYLLNMLEEIVGTENLYCLEDMYYIMSI
jgi:hypothetical protein